MILKKWTPGAHLLLKCYLKGKISRKLANGQNIDYSEKKKENGPRASSAPALGLNTIIFKYVYWYMKQISGERLQDHWSSGSSSVLKALVRNSSENFDIFKTIFGIYENKSKFSFHFTQYMDIGEKKKKTINFGTKSFLTF